MRRYFNLVHVVAYVWLDYELNFSTETLLDSEGLFFDENQIIRLKNQEEWYVNLDDEKIEFDWSVPLKLAHLAQKKTDLEVMYQNDLRQKQRYSDSQELFSYLDQYADPVELPSPDKNQVTSWMDYGDREEDMSIATLAGDEDLVVVTGDTHFHDDLQFRYGIDSVPAEIAFIALKDYVLDNDYQDYTIEDTERLAD